MKKYLEHQFALDFRSLSAFRIGLGLIILLDIIFRLTDFTSHYTEEGVAPMSLLFESSQDRYLKWSLFFLNESTAWAIFLFVILIYSAICFMIGYKTKIHSILLWILVLSVQARCPYINFGADSVIRLLLFWGMFLPLGERWSIDSRRNKDAKSGAYYSISGIAFTLQVVMIYWFNAVAKGHPTWRVDHSAARLHIL